MPLLEEVRERMVTTIDFDFFQVIFKPYVFASNAAKCVNSHKTCSISLLLTAQLSWSDNHLKALPEPNRGPQEKRVKSRLLPFTAKPKEPKVQRMKLEYKRMKLNTPPTTVYVPTFVYFADYFMSWVSYNVWKLIKMSHFLSLAVKIVLLRFESQKFKYFNIKARFARNVVKWDFLSEYKHCVSPQTSLHMAYFTTEF